MTPSGFGSIEDPAFSAWLLIFFKGSGEQIIVALTYRDSVDVIRASK
jgi:hypothetical protein